jgi:hypothetical protein
VVPRLRGVLLGYEVWKIGEDGFIAESGGHYDAGEYPHQLEPRGLTLESARRFPNVLWCARRDSNSRPNAPEAFALSS